MRLLHFPPRTRYYPTSVARNFQPTLPRGSLTSLTREHWKAEDIKLYLSDIVVDTEDLNKLVPKYARVLTDKDGPWDPARARGVEKNIVAPCSHTLPRLYDTL